MRPDAIFAELVHLPEDRLGNIVFRPAFRAHDLPYLGQSGLDRANQIHVADLSVAVQGGRIVLRSRTSGREILPRLTCAHNVKAPNASAYRFIAALAEQDGAASLGFSWDPLGRARFLPRVIYGNVVLSPASWRIDPATFSAWANMTPAQRSRLIGALREDRGIPRWIQVGYLDNLLSLDLDNPLCADALVDELKRSQSDRVRELLPSPADICFRSPEGKHVHEVMIPFLRRSQTPSVGATTKRRDEQFEPYRFPPGSRWLYAKIYGSLLLTEAALKSELHELIEHSRATGAVDRWHFVRYRDSDDHLRVRFHGEPGALRHAVQPRLEHLFGRLTNGGSIWRCQFDTYEREVVRYGGPVAIEIAEVIFDADSETVLKLLRAAPSDASPDWRWQLSVKLVDIYHEAFSLSIEQREQLAKRTDAAFRLEFRVDKEFEGQISRRFKRERALLESLFAESDGLPPELRWAEEVVLAFRTRLAPLAAQFVTLSKDDELTAPFEDIVSSLTHMHLNRMMLANPREHELIIHAFLQRMYRSKIARLLTGQRKAHVVNLPDSS